MNMHLARVAPFVLLGFAAVSRSASAAPAAVSLNGSLHASCRVAATGAAITDTLYADRPQIAEAEHLTGVSVLRIDLDETGRLEKAALLTSSGFPILDNTALSLARQARFVAETQNCVKVAGSYRATIVFTE